MMGGQMALRNGRGSPTGIPDLTCLEESIEITREPSPSLPEVWAEGTRFIVVFPEGN